MLQVFTYIVVVIQACYVNVYSNLKSCKVVSCSLYQWQFHTRTKLYFQKTQFHAETLCFIFVFSQYLKSQNSVCQYAFCSYQIFSTLFQPSAFWIFRMFTTSISLNKKGLQSVLYNYAFWIFSTSISAFSLLNMYKNFSHSFVPTEC